MAALRRWTLGQKIVRGNGMPWSGELTTTFQRPRARGGFGTMGCGPGSVAGSIPGVDCDQLIVMIIVIVIVSHSNSNNISNSNSNDTNTNTTTTTNNNNNQPTSKYRSGPCALNIASLTWHSSDGRGTSGTRRSPQPWICIYIYI